MSFEYDDDNSSLSSYLTDDPNRSQVLESPTFIVTDLLTSLGERTQDPDYLVTKGNDLVLLLRQYPYIKEDLVLSAFGHRLQTLLTHPKKEVVATGYRICRYVIHDLKSVQSLISLKLDLMIIVTLSKTSTHDIEREEALKLVRSFIDIPDGVGEITRGIAHAILSVAEQVDDKLRKISIETLCEIVLLRPDLILPQCLLQFIVDGPYELSTIVVTVFLSLLNKPEGRERIEVNDILRLISPFTEFPVKGYMNHEKLQATAFVISKCLKNFAGLHGFCLNNYEPLRNLLECLTYPINSVVSKLLDLLLDILLINPLTKKSNLSNRMVLIPYRIENEFILNTQYLSYLLVILLKCNIIDNLLYVVKKSTDENNCTKAAFLLTEIFNLAVNLVPDELSYGIVDRIPPVAGESQLNFEDSKRAVFLLEKLTRKSKKGRTIGATGLKVNENILETSKVFRNKANYYVDDVRLKQMIQDTKVLSTKNFSKWNCDIIGEIFSGPFMNGKRLEETNKTSKFLKRLLSFYRPFKRKFSNTKKTKLSQRFTKVGCEIIEALLATAEGRRILKESKLVPQIAECLAQVDPYSGFYAKDQIFSVQRLQTTLSDGYFKMLGVLSKNKYGVVLLENWRIFTIIYHISDHASKREDLLSLFMDEIKFNRQGHSRVLLSKFLHSDSRNLKVHATNLLASLIHDSECTSFVCELLIDQLYEQDEEICQEVVKILSDYCEESPENMNQIVGLAPSITLLRLSGEDGEALLMKFLSTSQGFEYLNEQGMIDEEFQNWTTGSRYLTYALEVDRLLLRLDRDGDGKDKKKKDLPPNFFGELVRTEEGFNVIVRSGIMTDFINILRHYSTSLDKEEETEIDYLRLKASLWSIGFICTSQQGVEAADVNGTIEDIILIAERSPLIDIKGCAFYVLGLVSKTFEGIEILDELGWSSKLDIYNNSIGIVVPRDPNVLIGWRDEVIDKSEIQEVIDQSLLNEIDPQDEVLKKLLKLVGNLCNHVFLNSSTKDLASLAKANPEYFEDPDVFFIVLGYFEIYRYRNTVRKFIIDLFVGNGRLLDVLVKRDKRRIKELLHH